MWILGSRRCVQDRFGFLFLLSIFCSLPYASFLFFFSFFFGAVSVGGTLCLFLTDVMRGTRMVCVMAVFELFSLLDYMYVMLYRVSCMLQYVLVRLAASFSGERDAGLHTTTLPAWVPHVPILQYHLQCLEYGHPYGHVNKASHIPKSSSTHSFCQFYELRKLNVHT